MSELDKSAIPDAIITLRPRVKEALRYITDAEHPQSAADLSEHFGWPYPTCVNYIKQLENLTLIEETHRMGKKRFFKSVKSVYKVISDKTVPKPRPKKVTGNSVAFKVYWPPAGKKMTLPQVLLWERENPSSNKTLKAINDIFKNIIRAALSDGHGDQEILRKDYKEMVDVRDHIKNVLSILDTCIDSPKLWDIKLVPIAVWKDDESFPEQAMYDIVMDPATMWGVNSLESQKEYPGYWLEALFFVTWNHPLTVEQISRILPGIPEAKLIHTLETYMNGDYNYFKEVKGRIPKWKSAFSDSKSAWVRKYGPRIATIGVLESVISVGVELRTDF